MDGKREWRRGGKGDGKMGRRKSLGEKDGKEGRRRDGRRAPVGRRFGRWAVRHLCLQEEEKKKKEKVEGEKKDIKGGRI